MSKSQMSVRACAAHHTLEAPIDTKLPEFDHPPAWSKSDRASKSGAYIGGKMNMPPGLAYAHGRLKAKSGATA
jgi:hypothetical protein